MNNPEWTAGVAQLACKCFHSTKNCSGIVFAGLMPNNHIKGKSASTSYENNLTRFYPLVHSCSNDRRWAIRFVSARIDFILVLSDRSNANFPMRPGATGSPQTADPVRTLSSLILSLSNRRRLNPARPVQLEPLPAKAENSSFAVFHWLPANRRRKHL